MVFLMSWDKDKDFGTELPSNRENYSPGMFRWWGTGGYSRLLILLFHPTEWGTAEVTKCQTKPFLVAFPAPKYVLADFFAFSGDSRNADCRQLLLFRFLPGVPADGTCRFVYSYWLLPALLIASEMLTASFFREWNSEFLSSIFQRFDFRGRNNRVWQVKLYCLTPQTILFGLRNNIVPGTFCLYSENEMYSFLKSKSFSGIFVCII